MRFLASDFCWDGPILCHCLLGSILKWEQWYCIYNIFVDGSVSGSWDRCNLGLTDAVVFLRI